MSPQSRGVSTSPNARNSRGNYDEDAAMRRRNTSPLSRDRILDGDVRDGAADVGYVKSGGSGSDLYMRDVLVGREGEDVGARRKAEYKPPVLR